LRRQPGLRRGSVGGKVKSAIKNRIGGGGVDVVGDELDNEAETRFSARSAGCFAKPEF